MAVIQRAATPIIDHSLDYIPIRNLEIELGQPLPTLKAFDDKKGRKYRRLRCLVRLHTQPLGLVDLQIDQEELDPNEYAPKIWHALYEPINEHLQRDGLPSATSLTSEGLTCFSTPGCIEERDQFLTHAPFVSVIVPTHDRPEELATCLSSLMSLCYPHFEVIVVDNAPSTNATDELVKKFSQDAFSIRYVREDRVGPSWARNCGIAVARGKILAFIDDDVVVDPYWLVGLARAFGESENVVCVTGLILPLELETPAQFLFEEYGGFNKGFTQRVYDMRSNPSKDPLYPYTAGKFGTGANMAFKASFLHRVNGFDPSLGPGSRAQGGEDCAAFFQVIIQGFKLLYEPASLVYHLHRRDYEDLRKQIHHYGVGVIAYLTKSILENPYLLIDLITKVPYGLFFIFSNRSLKNRNKSAHYPKELTTLERKGMLYGSFAYLRNRWDARKLT